MPSLFPKGKICSLGIIKFMSLPGIQGSKSPFIDKISAKDMPYFLAISINVSSCFVI